MDFLGFVVDFIIDFMTQDAVDGLIDAKKGKGTIRYALFTVFMFIAVIGLFVVCWNCYKEKQTGFVIGFGILEVIMAVLWAMVAIRKRKRE